MVVSEFPLHPMVLATAPLDAEQPTDSLAKSFAGESVQRYSALQNFLLMSTPEEFQRFELLNYTNTNGEELVGLAVGLVEDPSGGVQVLVFRDSNVVSCVSVVPLKECAVTTSQQCDCCE